MALTDENNGGIGATMLVGPTGMNNGGCRRIRQCNKYGDYQGASLLLLLVDS